MQRLFARDLILALAIIQHQQQWLLSGQSFRHLDILFKEITLLHARRSLTRRVTSYKLFKLQYVKPCWIVDRGLMRRKL